MTIPTVTVTQPAADWAAHLPAIREAVARRTVPAGWRPAEFVMTKAEAERVVRELDARLVDAMDVRYAPTQPVSAALPWDEWGLLCGELGRANLDPACGRHGAVTRFVRAAIPIVEARLAAEATDPVLIALKAEEQAAEELAAARRRADAAAAAFAAAQQRAEDARRDALRLLHGPQPDTPTEGPADADPEPAARP